MSKEKDKILRTLEHIAITFDKLGYSPTIPIFTGHQDFEYLFKLELGTIKELCNQQDRRVAELEEQLKNARKEIAKKVIDRVEELSVFDFKAYEEHDLRKYTITKLALDNILREFQGENK